jgi:ketosteroid isomerase-like protein
MLERLAQRNMRAMERKDLAAIMRGWAPDGVLEIAGRSSVSGRYEGKPAIEAFFRQLFDRIDTVRVTVRRVALANPVGFTYANTVFIEYELDETRQAGATMHGHCVGVFEYRRGKVVAMREWWFDPTVLDVMWGSGAALTSD